MRGMAQLARAPLLVAEAVQYGNLFAQLLRAALDVGAMPLESLDLLQRLPRHLELDGWDKAQLGGAIRRHCYLDLNHAVVPLSRAGDPPGASLARPRVPRTR